MRTFIINSFVVALLAMGPVLNAQSLILQGGINGSRWGSEAFDLLEDFGSVDLSRKVKIGYQIEALVDIPLKEKLTLSPGLRFNKIGITIEMPSLPGLIEAGSGMDISASFIELPLSLRYYHTVSSDLKVYGSAGAYFGGLLMTSIEVEETYDGEPETYSDSQMAEEFVPTYGIEIGAGVDYKKWLAGLSFKYGVFGKGGVVFSPGVVSVNLGYRLF